MKCIVDFLRVTFTVSALAPALLLATAAPALAEIKTTADDKGNLASPARATTSNQLKSNRSDKAKRYVEDELLVKFRPSVTESAKLAKHKKRNAELIRDHKGLRLQRLRLKKGVAVEAALAEYASDPDVEYAEPNYIVSAQNTPDDPKFGELWGMTNIAAPAAWDVATGNGNVVVAVIDTGIDYTHPDLIPNMWVNTAEKNGTTGVDNDGNGYLDDIHGYNVITNGGDPMDDHYHGTHVAGTIGAAGNNAIGVAGLNWNVQLMGCKFLGSNGSGNTDDAVGCLEYVKTMKSRGVNIAATNNSWGSFAYSQALYDAIRDQQDILFVAAAGNDSTSELFYPADYDLPNIISVAASGPSDDKASFSNWNKGFVHIAAPGQDIVSTAPDGGYLTLSGTSMAAPHVCGLAALLKSQDGERSAAQLKNLILAGGDPVSAFSEITITGRRINAYRSLTCSDSPLITVLHPPTQPQAGVPQTLSVLSINCGSAVGPVSVALFGGGSVPLRDDGAAPDEVAGDGIFTGVWVPVSNAAEAFTFTSPAGSTTVAAPPVTIGGVLNVSAGATILPYDSTSAGINVPFSQSFAVSGGIPPYTWSVTASTSLPPGLTLNAGTGEISGTPTTTGDFSTRLQVTDRVGGKDWKDWDLVVNSGLRPGWPRELQPRLGYGPLPVSYAPIFADLDGDGSDEIIVADNNTLYIFLADGSVRKTVLPQAMTTPVVADLDGDGRKEIIVAMMTTMYDRDSIYAFRSDLSLLPGFPARGYSTVNAGPGWLRTPVVGDFDNDGHVEIAVIASPNYIEDEFYGKSVMFIVNHLGQTLPGWPKVLWEYRHEDVVPAVGDLDHDGKMELVLVGPDGYLYVFHSDGTEVAKWQIAPAQEIQAPALADMDGDGFLDIVVKYRVDGEETINVLDRNGVPLPGWPRTLSPSNAGIPGLAIGDLDGDGRPEIVAFSGIGYNELHALRGDGSSLPNWPLYLVAASDGMPFIAAPLIADLDGDGQSEVLVTTMAQGKAGMVIAYNASGAHVPGFPKYASGKNSQIRTSPALGDFDGNGKLDLVVKSENGFLYTWEMTQQSNTEELQWPMFRRNAQHDSAWYVNRPLLAPLNHDFKSVPVGASSPSRSFSVTNRRSSAITISSISLAGRDGAMFSLSPGTCGTTPMTLAAGQSCSVEVSFSPTTGGDKSALLSVASSTKGIAAAQVALTGSAVAASYTLSYTRKGGGSGAVTTSTGWTYADSRDELVGADTVVALTASPGDGSVFTGWEGACTGTGPCSVTMDRARQVSATFESGASVYRLDIVRSGEAQGQATFTPGGTCPSWCDRLYASGTVVTLNAPLSAGSRFTGWSGCDSASGTSCTVTMSANRSVTASYRSITDIGAGSMHSLALKKDGTVWTWGNNGFYQLGDGSSQQRSTPVEVVDLSGVVQVATRNVHSAALRSDGTIWTWGANFDGQLGDGTTSQRSKPAPVPDMAGVVAVATGSHTLALKEDGTVWSWGSNWSGQLGDGTKIKRSVPSQVPGLSGVVAIAAGQGHSVALKGDGTVWAWGDNAYRQVGYVTGSTRTTPVQVPGIADVVAIEAGAWHTLARKRDGSLWAWGENYYGQYGNGSTAQAFNPVPVTTVPGMAGIRGGSYHTVAFLADGGVKAWGRNESGQVGDTTLTDRSTPVSVGGISGAVGVAGGETHSLALTSDGSVWAWGSNSSAQLGDGTTTSRLTPVQLPGFFLSSPWKLVVEGQSDEMFASFADLLLAAPAAPRLKMLLRSGDFSEELSINRCDQSLTISGGMDASFSAVSGKSSIRGAVRISCGKVMVEGLTLK